MRMPPFFAALAFCCLAAAPIAAQALDCKNVVSDHDIAACAGRDLQVADKRLNDAYQRLMKGAVLEDDAARGLLRDAQRKWIVFRDAECARESDQMRGGTGQRVLHASCLLMMTEERAKKLEEILMRGY